MEGIVCRGERLVIPAGQLPRDEGNVRDWVVELGHSGHMGISATKRLLRHRLWFPGMDHMVERRVSTCLPCQAATDSPHRDPLKPNPAPEEPWIRLACDHWGPTKDGSHILVVIDTLTRYPEVEVVKGTGADNNIHAFSRIFTRHGYPRILHSDNGPPFNGKESHLLQRYFKSVGVKHVPNHSAQDPESTGGVEAFMKHLKKVFHTAEVNKEDPYLRIDHHLMHFRATPHPTTGKPPAELLFGRKFVTTLPDLRSNPARGRKDVQEARECDRIKKEKMKAYKDGKNNVRPTNLQVGDKVLLKRKSTKHNSPYDPRPYTVTRIWGTQVEGTRDTDSKTRDAQLWKKVVITQHPKRFGQKEEVSDYGSNADIGAGFHANQTEARPQPRGDAVPPVPNVNLPRRRRLREAWITREAAAAVIPATPANRASRRTRTKFVPFQAGGR